MSELTESLILSIFLICFAGFFLVGIRSCDEQAEIDAKRTAAHVSQMSPDVRQAVGGK